VAWGVEESPKKQWKNWVRGGENRELGLTRAIGGGGGEKKMKRGLEGRYEVSAMLCKEIRLGVGEGLAGGFKVVLAGDRMGEGHVRVRWRPGTNANRPSGPICEGRVLVGGGYSGWGYAWGNCFWLVEPQLTKSNSQPKVQFAQRGGGKKKGEGT